jgi:hypothetical protein
MKSIRFCARHTSTHACPTKNMEHQNLSSYAPSPKAPNCAMEVLKSMTGLTLTLLIFGGFDHGSTCGHREKAHATVELESLHQINHYFFYTFPNNARWESKLERASIDMLICHATVLGYSLIEQKFRDKCCKHQIHWKICSTNFVFFKFIFSWAY